MPCTLLIVESDRPVPESPGRWKEGEIVLIVDEPYTFGSGELDLTKFLRFTVSDKTAAEMTQYTETWNRRIEMDVINGPDPSGFRRINVQNTFTNASGNIGEWTTETTDNIIAEWNGRYPTCNLVTVSFPDPATWQCEGTFTTGQAQEFNEVIIEQGLETLDKRRVWWITPAGMTNIRDAGGHQTGTAQQLGGILQDGLTT